MAVLNDEQVMETISRLIGDDTSDEKLQDLENLTDTYSSLKQAGQKEDEEDWKEKYYQNDEAWRKKYQRRFFSGGTFNTFGGEEGEAQESQEKEVTPETITIDDLFKD